VKEVKIITELFEFVPGRPKYRQVADDIRRRIRDGELQVGDSLGDLGKLEKHYGCSWGTVQAGERLLVDEGLLSQIRAGIPTRVVAVPSQLEPSVTLVRLRKLREELDEIIDDLEAA
jgi:DNA-binding transcriptional regulator YhcF (GntR family)